MFADVLFPPNPTYCNDWYMAGWPASLIIPCALSLSLIALFVVVMRRARPLWSFLTLVLCVVLFLVVNYAVYEFGCQNNEEVWRKPYTPRVPPMEPKTLPIVKPTEY